MERAVYAIAFRRKHPDVWLPYGTGFFASPDGWFLTCAHLFPDGAEEMRLMRVQQDGSVATLERVVPVSGPWFDKDRDIALLRFSVPPRFRAFLPVRPASYSFGRTVHLFGYPLPDWIYDPGAVRVRIGPCS